MKKNIVYINELFFKITKIKKISPTKLFTKQSNIDSLDLLHLFFHLEKKFNIKFKSSELAKLNSINNILKIIKKKISEKKSIKKRQ